MSISTFVIQPFDKESASEAEYAAFNRHTNRMRRERLPDDPPIPLEETIQNMQSIPPFVKVDLWAAWDPEGKDILAVGNVIMPRTDDNRHMAQFDISVQPEYRRQGLGRRFLELIARAAREDSRRLLITQTNARAVGGEEFMLRLGARKGLEAHTNQLDMAELDQERVSQWLAQGEQNQGEFELGFWDGAYPEDVLEQVVELVELTNQQPLDNLEVEAVHTNPERLRQVENNLFARGYQRWTFYLVDRASGKYAGYTDILWHPDRPQILQQDMTGVFPQYRRKGLGRWLKAAMLDKILRERPEVRFVRTGNADSNASMLHINRELGFKPYMAEALWQVELDNVDRYLQGAG
jgi:mycothiol synthase